MRLLFFAFLYLSAAVMFLGNDPLHYAIGAMGIAGAGWLLARRQEL